MARSGSLVPLALVSLSLVLPTPLAPADAQITHLTQPASDLTRSEAVSAFGDALFACLRTRLDNHAIRDLPAADRADLRPASKDDRAWAGRQPAHAPIWVTSRLGYVLDVAEPSADRCEVHAIQLPVEDTFHAVRLAMAAAFPDFKDAPLKPGYNPIAYQLEMVADGARYVIHLEGAEPGEPGHAFRFSLLTAVIVRQPADQPAAFREVEG